MALSVLNDKFCLGGRGVWVEVDRRADVDTVRRLVEIKMAN